MITVLALIGAAGLILFRYAGNDLRPTERRETATPTALTPQSPSPPPELRPLKNLPGPALAIMSSIRKAFQEKRYKEALQIAGKELQSQSSANVAFHHWLQKQLPVLRTSLAWQLLNQGKCSEALEYFGQVIQQLPVAEAYKGIAFCHQKAGLWGPAEEAILEYRKQRPDDPGVNLLFVDILESTGRFEEGVEILGKLAAAPTGNLKQEVLQKKLSAMRARARESGHQVQITSDHFTLTYRAEHEAFAGQAIEDLEEALHEFNSQLEIPWPDSPIEVLLYPRQDFRQLVSNSPPWARAIFDGRIRVPLPPGDNPGPAINRDLRHELTHALLARQTAGRRLPSWFNEGIARFLECPGGCRSFTFPQTRTRLLEPGELEGSFLHFSHSRAALAYKQSHFLILCLTRLGLRGSDSPLHDIIRSLHPGTGSGSEKLVQAAHLNWRTFYREARGLWDQRRLPPSSP